MKLVKYGHDDCPYGRLEGESGISKVNEYKVLKKRRAT
jgi:hypothetical protein